MKFRRYRSASRSAIARSASSSCPFLMICSGAAILFTFYLLPFTFYLLLKWDLWDLWDLCVSLSLCLSVSLFPVSLSLSLCLCGHFSSSPDLAGHLQQRQVDRQQDRDHYAGHRQQDRRFNQAGQLPEFGFRLRVIKPGDLIEHLSQRSRALAHANHINGQFRHPTRRGEAFGERFPFADFRERRLSRSQQVAVGDRLEGDLESFDDGDATRAHRPN